MHQVGGQGGQLPPRFWRIRRRRRAAAARRITSCPPRFLDFATCLYLDKAAKPKQLVSVPFPSKSKMEKKSKKTSMLSFYRVLKRKADVLGKTVHAYLRARSLRARATKSSLSSRRSRRSLTPAASVVYESASRVHTGQRFFLKSC